MSWEMLRCSRRQFEYRLVTSRVPQDSFPQGPVQTVGLPEWDAAGCEEVGEVGRGHEADLGRLPHPRPVEFRFCKKGFEGME